MGVWPSLRDAVLDAGLSEAEAYRVIDFGMYRGKTINDLVESKDVNYILWFLAHDINSGKYMRNILLCAFSVLYEDGYDYLLHKDTGTRLYKKWHVPEGEAMEPGCARPDHPPPPANPAPKPPGNTGSAQERGVRHDPRRGASTDDLCPYWLTGRGCRDLQRGRCRLRHPLFHDGKNFIEMNQCHRNQRGRCGDQQFCGCLHSRGDKARQLIVDRETRCFDGIQPQSPLNLVDAPLYYILRDGLAAESTTMQNPVLDALMEVFTSAPLELTPVGTYGEESVGFARVLLADTNKHT